MISHNSSLSKPIPLVSTAGHAPEPSARVESTPVEFSGLGSEYFRIWIVNLLLILVTLGLYYPWAKVRKLKYFYNNTRVDEHALDFHGNPWAILRGYLITVALFFVFSSAMEFSAITALIAAVVISALAPVLFRGANRFRMANSSWRGMRMRFVQHPIQEAFTSVMPPVMLFLLPTVLGSFAAESMAHPAEPDSLLINLALSASAIFAIAAPYFFWRIKRYQHNHYAWGPLQTEYRSSVAETYKVFGMTVLVVILILLAFAAIVFLMWPSGTGSLRSWSRNFGLIVGLFFPLLIGLIILINILPRAYFTAKMQNLLWSRTGNKHFRFKSDLSVGKFIGLQFKNYFLIVITLGLYWPFAVIATQRMKLEAVSLKTRVAFDKLTDAARARENDAAGDMAADIFGFDVGM